jgi:diamine N-acetyltransferase
MSIFTNSNIQIQKLAPVDYKDLHKFLNRLSASTKAKFAPHNFDLQTIININSNPGLHKSYIARDAETNSVIAYCIVKMGVFEYDVERYKNYNIHLSDGNCCTFAPSLADEWQGKGLGKILFQFILHDLKDTVVKKMILWGGVQDTNHLAISFYTKRGFKIVGSFEYNGTNIDMIFYF